MPNRFRYTPSLDGIRCVAIGLVLLSNAAYGLINYVGSFGVHLFFVLSGYLITALLKREFEENKSISLRHFYMRRALRLGPALLLGVFLGCVLWPYTPETADNPHRTLAAAGSLFYFANVVDWAALGTFGHFWSLAVEEHFYFVWPLLASAVLFKSTLRRQVAALLVAVVAVMVLRYFAFHFHMADRKLWGVLRIDPAFFTLCRIDGMLLGALIAIATPAGVARRIQGFSDGAALAIVALLLACGLLVARNWRYSFYAAGFTLVDIFCMLAVLFVANKPKLAIFASAPFVWIGRRSYGLYVFHGFVIAYLETFRIRHNTANLILIMSLRFGLTLLLAVVSYRFIESPILAYKRKFESTRD